MNIFFAFPFTDYLDKKSGQLQGKYKDFLSEVRQALIQEGHNVFLAHYREKWGKELMSPDVCTQADLIELKKADIVVSFPGYPMSGGVHVEMGWASALEKKVIFFLQNGISYSPLIIGLHMITDVDYYTYDDCLENGLCERIIESVAVRSEA